MKSAREVMEATAFSHRPDDGISIGIYVQDNIAFLAVGFVREGDQFSRKVARNIVSQRIASALAGDEPKRVTWVSPTPSSVDARAIIREFRKEFKPDHYCNDSIFFKSSKMATSTGLNVIEVREQLSREESWSKIVAMFGRAVANATPSKVTA